MIHRIIFIVFGLLFGFKANASFTRHVLEEGCTQALTPPYKTTLFSILSNLSHPLSSSTHTRLPSFGTLSPFNVHTPVTLNKWIQTQRYHSSSQPNVFPSSLFFNKPKEKTLFHLFAPITRLTLTGIFPEEVLQALKKEGSFSTLEFLHLKDTHFTRTMFLALLNLPQKELELKISNTPSFIVAKHEHNDMYVEFLLQAQARKWKIIIEESPLNYSQELDE